MSLDILAEPLRPPNVLDGCAIHVKSLVTEAHGAALDSDTDSDPDPVWLTPNFELGVSMK